MGTSFWVCLNDDLSHRKIPFWQRPMGGFLSSNHLSVGIAFEDFFCLAVVLVVRFHNMNKLRNNSEWARSHANLWFFFLMLLFYHCCFLYADKWNVSCLLCPGASHVVSVSPGCIFPSPPLSYFCPKRGSCWWPSQLLSTRQGSFKYTALLSRMMKRSLWQKLQCVVH